MARSMGRLVSAFRSLRPAMLTLAGGTAAVFGHDRFGRGDTRLQQRMRTQLGDDFRQVVGEPLQDAQRRRRIARKTPCDSDPGRKVGRLQQPQREFGVLALLRGRVAEPVNIKIGEDPQQGRTHVGASACAEVGKALETEDVLKPHCR